MGKMFRKITVRTVPDLIKTHSDSLAGYVFRGHANSKWRLQTTMERTARTIPCKEWETLEQKVMTEFKRRAHHYLSDLPKEKNHLEWLALMQHHGCPTRLLDFTRSFFVGLFFAIEGASSDSALWAINLEYYVRRLGIPASDDHLHSTYIPKAEKEANNILSHSNKKPYKSNILLVEPYRMSERLSIQQGLFLFPQNLI